MSKTEPTAGEWKACGDYVIAFDGARETNVAKSLAITGTRSRERLGNLLVLAASKDLLTACEAALEYAEHGRCDFDYVTRLRDAIAKAKGET